MKDLIEIIAKLNEKKKEIGDIDNEIHALLSKQAELIKNSIDAEFKSLGFTDHYVSVRVLEQDRFIYGSQSRIGGSFKFNSSKENKTLFWVVFSISSDGSDLDFEFQEGNRFKANDFYALHKISNVIKGLTGIK